MNALIKDCIKLVTITVIAGAALGAVYGITKEPIAAQEEKTQMEAYAAVFPDAADFEEVDGFSPEAAAKVLASVIILSTVTKMMRSPLWLRRWTLPERPSDIFLM